MAQVDYLDQAAEELAALPVEEKTAMDTAVEKLKAMGLQLPFPHVSHVQNVSVSDLGALGLWELRPRSGHSPWRAFYKRVQKDAFVIAAIGPEAEVDRKGFQAAVRKAAKRLERFEHPT